MDQDYHYFATYLAAMISGRNNDDASLIARAANYVDFFNEQRFRGYWVFKKNGVQIAKVDYPRYTFQANISGQAVGAEGLWAAFHFLPGNYEVQKQYVKKLPDTIVKEMTEGTFKKRDNTSGDDRTNHWRLTRPLSALSRAIATDTHLLAKDGIREILFHGTGLRDLIDKEKDKYIEERFFKILTGIRAHVIADTWAHQDFTGVRSVVNTYYDVEKLKSKTYGIKYKIPEKQEYTYTVLRHKGGHPFEDMPKGVFESAPALGKLAYLGHGWMGHLPDYSFISYQYRPCWKKDYDVHDRNNPAVYFDAFYDILYFLYLAEGTEGDQAPWRAIARNKDLIKKAITTVWSHISKIPRVVSSDAWRTCIKEIVHQPPPPLNTFMETGDHAKLDGEEKIQFKAKQIFTAYGTFTMEIMNSQGKPSDFYLFQLAADYHFQYVKSWLSIVRNHNLSDSWSVQPGPLGSEIKELTDKRVKLLTAPPLERQKGGPLKRSPLPKVDSKLKE